MERSQRLSVAFLGLRGIIILLTPFPSNLGHFRGVLSDFKRALPKCLRTGAVIFAFYGVFEAWGYNYTPKPLNARQR